MNNIDKLTQKIFSKFNDDSLFYCNIYLTGTEENNAVVLFDMEGFILKVCLDKVKTEYTMPEDSYVLVYEMCIDENENVIHFSVWSEERGDEDFELKFDWRRLPDETVLGRGAAGAAAGNVPPHLDAAKRRRLFGFYQR